MFYHVFFSSLTDYQGVFILSKKSITRRWIGTGTQNQLQTYTEQRYISKHSSSYHHFVHRAADWQYFLQQVATDIKAIQTALDKIPSNPVKADVQSAVNVIESSSKFTVSANRTNVLKARHLPEQLQQLTKERCNDFIEECCHGAVLPLSGNCPIGVKSPIDDISSLREMLAKWKLFLFGSTTQKEPAKKTNTSAATPSTKAKTNKKQAKSSGPHKPTTVTELSAVISIDFEWQAHTGTETDEIGEIQKHSATRRSFSDVLSCQYAIFLPDYPSVKIQGIIFNDDSLGFNFKQLLIKFVSIIQQEFHALDHTNQPVVLNLQKLKVLLTGYFLGVDFSCATGWNKLPIHLVVQGKHRIFSTQPYPLFLRHRKSDAGIKVSLTVRDTASISPMGGLRKLGELVNQPKIDVTKQDAIDFAIHKIGLADYCRFLSDGGFYKNHMKLLQQRHFKLYCDYALNDAVVALRYLRMFVHTFSLSWKDFNKLPPTTTNNAISAIATALSTDCINQRIYNPEIAFSEVKKDPVAACRDYYRDIFIAATKAYVGGFNVAFSSVVTSGNIVDTDLASAYPSAASLMPVADYSKPRVINTLNHLFYSLTSLDEYSKISFEELYDHLKKAEGFPFIFGTCLIDVDYPNDYSGIITTPQRSHETGNPVFVKHLSHQYLTLIDAIDAFEHGAHIKLYSAEIPAQNWKTYNAWADVQLRFVALRNQAKAQRNKFSPESGEYKKYDALQTLYKLAANVVYGGSAQAVLPKNTRSYLTNRTEQISISKVTDPVVAGTYTAITRYLVHTLYDSVASVYKANVLPLNITTDGYSFMLPAGQKFSFDDVNGVFSSKLSDFYHSRLKEIGFDAGFARKGDTSDTPTTVYNLRTRLNGTPSLASLEAMGGITGMSPKTLWPIVKSGQVVLKNKAKRFSNLTDMKYGTKRSNHQSGVMLEWEQLVNVPLQYDCAYKPDKWLDNRWPGYGFTAVPFNTVEEHDTWKKHSKLLTDRWNIMKKSEYFQAYLNTIENYSFARTEQTLDAPDYSDRVRYVLDRISGKQIPTNRRYKNSLYNTQQAVKKGTKLPICPMAIYNNWKLKDGDANDE